MPPRKLPKAHNRRYLDLRMRVTGSERVGLWEGEGGG
jgi:hypothetical protein